MKLRRILYILDKENTEGITTFSNVKRNNLTEFLFVNLIGIIFLIKYITYLQWIHITQLGFNSHTTIFVYETTLRETPLLRIFQLHSLDDTYALVTHSAQNDYIVYYKQA